MNRIIASSDSDYNWDGLLRPSGASHDGVGERPNIGNSAIIHPPSVAPTAPAAETAAAVPLRIIEITVAELYAMILHRLTDLRSDAGHRPEQARLCSVAITQAETAQLWAAKAIDWKD